MPKKIIRGNNDKLKNNPKNKVKPESDIYNNFFCFIPFNIKKKAIIAKIGKNESLIGINNTTLGININKNTLLNAVLAPYSIFEE